MGIAVALAGLALALAAHAQPVAYRIDEARTSATFDVDHLGILRAHGVFDGVSGHLVLDTAARAGAIELDIPVASVATGWRARDRFVRGEAMLDADRFPRMRFRSTRFEFDGARLARVDGELTLRDVTRPVSLTVRRMDCALACVAEASGTLGRRDFGLDAWWPVVGDRVDLNLVVTAVRQ